MGDCIMKLRFWKKKKQDRHWFKSSTLTKKQRKILKNEKQKNRQNADIL